MHPKLGNLFQLFVNLMRVLQEINQSKCYIGIPKINLPHVLLRKSIDVSCKRFNIPSCSALLRKRDQQYLADASIPAHPLQARGGQDDGRVILLVVQLLEPSVQVPSLERGN